MSTERPSKESDDAPEQFAADASVVAILKQAASSLDLPGFRAPRFTIPELPKFEMPELPDIATQEELNDYRSAAALMQQIAEAALEWKETLPADFQPVIVAVLSGGIQIEVRNLAQVSFHGIRVDGFVNDSPCTVLAHQSTVQILCYVQRVTPKSPRNPIGFVWSEMQVEV